MDWNICKLLFGMLLTQRSCSVMLRSLLFTPNFSCFLSAINRQIFYYLVSSSTKILSIQKGLAPADSSSYPSLHYLRCPHSRDYSKCYNIPLYFNTPSFFRNIYCIKFSFHGHTLCLHLLLFLKLWYADIDITYFWPPTYF